MDEMGVRLCNEGNSHWTLYLPKQDALAIQPQQDALAIQHPVIAPIQDALRTDKRNQLRNKRQALTPEYRQYLIEKELDLTLRELFNELDEHDIENLEVDACTDLFQKYSDLIALYGASFALENYLAQHGAVGVERHPYDESYLRLEYERCRLKYMSDLEPDQKTARYLEISTQRDQIRVQAIQEIRDNAAFQRSVAQLEPKKAPSPEPHYNAPSKKCSRTRIKTKLGNRKPSSAYPGYALNGCFGGLILGAIIVGSSPELVAVTAAALSFSPIGAVCMLLVASMFIATMLTLLTLYVMDKCKPSVAPAHRIG